MSPISLLANGTAAVLPNLSAAAAAPSACAGPLASSTGTPAAAVSATPATGSTIPSAAQVMVSQVVSSLRASFSISATPSSVSAALTPAEHADQSFSSTLAQAVHAGDGTDTSLDVVRSAVLQALGNVSQYLLGIGAASSDVSAASDSMQARLQALMSGVTPGGGVAVQATLVQKEKATLQIRTADGDVVTLGLRARSSTTASFAAGAATDAGTAGAASLTTINGARISVDVQGNISAAEATAIGDVIGQVESLANQFFSGDVAQAFASAASLQIDSTQLASVALRLRFSASYSAIAVTEAPPAATGSSAAGTSGATPAAPAARPPAASAPATSAPAAVAPDSTATAPDSTAATNAAATSPAATTPATDTTTTASPPSIMSILQSFLQQVLDFALAGSGNDSVMASAHMRLKLLLAVTETIAPVSTPADGTGTTGGAAAPAAAVAKLGSVVGKISNQLA